MHDCVSFAEQKFSKKKFCFDKFLFFFDNSGILLVKKKSTKVINSTNFLT